MRTNNNGACDAPYKTELKIRAECEERRKIMLTLNIDYEVLPDRLVTIKLPESVRVGRHELVIVLEERPLPPEGAKALSEANKLNDLIKKRYALSLSEPLLDAEDIFAKMAARHAE